MPSLSSCSSAWVIEVSDVGWLHPTCLLTTEGGCVLAVIQVLSRYWALWGIVAVAPEATSTGALTLFKAGPVTLQLNMITLLFCWSVTEVLRYGFYAAKVTLSLTF